MSFINFDFLRSRPQLSELRLLMVLVVSVFVIETLVMILLSMLPLLPAIATMVLDATLLSALLLPLFYHLVYKPLILVINERKDSEIRLHALFDNTSAIGIVVIDQQRRIEEFNLASQAMFGYSKEEVIGKNVNLLMPEPFRSMHDAWVINNLASGRQNTAGFNRELEALRKDGSIFPISLVVDRVNAGDSAIFIGFIKDVTERNRMEEELRKSEEKYRELFDNASDFVYSTDEHGYFTSVNRALIDVLGYGGEEIIGEHISKIMSPENLAIAQKMSARKQSGEMKVTQYELEIICKDGRIVPVEVNSRLIYRNGAYAGVHWTGRDITDRREAEQAQRLAALVYENSNEAMMIVDADNRIIAINPAFTEVTGYSREDALGETPKLLSSGRHDAEFYQKMWRALTTTGHWQGELWNKRKDGELYCEWLSINTIFNANGTAHRRVAIFSDITRKKEADELIWKYANFDSLTQLPNRRLFNDRLEQEISKSHRSGLQVALMFIDLDRFKEVNDTLGHAQGDVLLGEAARRIVDCVRESDTVARMGGDEFTVILPELGDIGVIDRISREIVARLAEPFLLLGKNVAISASIGVALYPGDATEIEELLKKSDKAMYAAKELGRNRYHYFNSAAS
ncbi:MAG TPA: PAS domain S-box protein [Gallionellaceae bacterium]|nr:PAS domain S-box protein [Gallionellaceae bacterium]